jgi:hypothetical protein
MRSIATRARSALRSVRALVVRAPFESAVFVVALGYVALHLSPSSYALALNLLGDDASPLLGSPRAIRTDEWSVMTPLFEATVANDFRETNETSFYGETLRSFIGLPIVNWGLVFKPVVWPFFVVSPALAYSFFWAAAAALMLIGWSVLLRSLGLSRTVSALASTILYFSPFVQAWSGPSLQLAIFPWLLVAFVRIRSPIRLGATLALLVPVWTLSIFYFPAAPPLLYLALVLCLALAPEALRPRRIAAALVGSGIGGAITLAYYAPVLDAYADSVYPGSRWFEGGELPGWQVLSQFLPGTTTEGYVHLLTDNICEVATVATWLPVLTLCAVDYRALRRDWTVGTVRRDVRRIGVIVGGWGLITLWQLVPLAPLSYVLGWGWSPEGRTLFASGALLVVAAAYALDRLPLRLSVWRLTAFATIVVAAWLAARVDLQPDAGVVVRDELLVLVIAIGLLPLALRRGGPSQNATRFALLLMALLPTAFAWGLFNPLQSTRVMFERPETDVTSRLDALSARRPDGAIAVDGIPDAILNGVGYRSVTHVIVTPSPETFRQYFPDLKEKRFNHIFNRFAHYGLTDRSEPYVASPDNVRLPIETMRRHASTFPEGVSYP